jgi:hypothetical protein
MVNVNSVINAIAKLNPVQVAIVDAKDNGTQYAKRNVVLSIGNGTMASSRFPVPFTVVRVNPVRPEMVIRETYGNVTTERKVRFSVYAHAVRVHGVKVIGSSK